MNSDYDDPVFLYGWKVSVKQQNVDHDTIADKIFYLFLKEQKNEEGSQ